MMKKVETKKTRIKKSPPTLPLFSIQSFGLSDVGLIRERNEDAWLALPENNFFVLADGMGGHPAGDVAASETVNSLGELIKKQKKKKESVESSCRSLLAAIQEVNGAVYRRSQSSEELKGMGTTLCCLRFIEEGLIYAHVGDSRLYRLREGKLLQLTKDHSLLQELLHRSQISEKKAHDCTYRHVITKAIGTEPIVVPSLGFSALQEEDLYLMCSDGLSDLVSPYEMEEILGHSPSLEASSKSLVEAAKEKGGFDNITVILIQLSPTHVPAALS